MRKTTILFTVLIGVLSMMLMFGDNGFLQSAYALTTNTDTVVSGANNQCAHIPTRHYIVCIPNESASTSHTISYFRSDVVNPTISTIPVSAQQGGCDPISNPCLADGGSVSCYNCDYHTVAYTGKLGGLWCGINDCFTWWITSGSYSNQLIRITLFGGVSQVTGYMNVSSSTLILPSIWGVDIGSGGIGGISIFTLRCPSGCGGIGTLYKTGGTSQMGDVASVTTSQAFTGSGSSVLGWGNTNIDGCWFCDGTIATSNNKYIAISSKQGVTTNRAITIIHADTMTLACGTTNSVQGFSSSQHTGLIRFYNSTKWLYATDDSIYLVGLASCSKTATTTYSTLGLSNYVEDVRTIKDSGNNNTGSVFWIQHGSASTINSISQANMTTFNTLVNFDNTLGNTISGYIHGTTLVNSLAVDNVSHEIVRTDDSARVQILYLNNFIPATTTGGTVSSGGTDCDLPANKFILICRLGQKGAESGSAGAFVIGNTENRTGIVGLGCNMGIVDCSVNDDVKSNGLGYLIFIASIFIVFGMFYYSLGAEGTFSIPLFAWILIIIALSAFFTITNIIDPVFLILSVIVIIAMAVPKILSVVKGGVGGFGGGSTE